MTPSYCNVAKRYMESSGVAGMMKLLSNGAVETCFIKRNNNCYLFKSGAV